MQDYNYDRTESSALNDEISAAEVARRLDELRLDMREGFARIELIVVKAHNNYEERLRALEHWRERLLGIWIGLVALAALLGRVAEWIFIKFTK